MPKIIMKEKGKKSRVLKTTKSTNDAVRYIALKARHNYPESTRFDIVRKNMTLSQHKKKYGW